MSYGKGRSVIAQKERKYLRQHPGTMTGTIKYLAEKQDQEYQARRRKLAWIGLAVKEFHDEQREEKI